nr:molybdenum cofactor guanylyltransferase [Ktedonobacteraceae bacterium]
MNETVSCIILAGGRSKRMGKDKALLSLPGHEQITFVDHLATLLATVGREVLLVARDATSALDYVSLANVRIVTDQVPDQGPLMGLYSGLSAMHPVATHALVVAVDMPFVQPALLSYLLTHLQQELVPGGSADPHQDRHKAPTASSQHYYLSPGQGAVPTHASSDAILMPVVQSAPQVLLAVYPRAILPIVEECLRQGRHDLRTLLKVAPVSYIEEAQLRQVDPQLRSFVNVNTPEELQSIS